MINQIKKINDIISNLENDTKLIVEDQIKDIETQFEEMKEMIAGNLQKLHLGVISKTVHQIIDSVLTTRMQLIVDGFNVKLLTKIKGIIKSIVENVNEVAGSSLKTGESLENMFATVIEDFSNSVNVAEEKIKGISDAILLSFQELRDIFSTKVVDTLNQELTKILDRLSVSQVTTQEFWDQAKKKSLMTMKDIWFIRSLEGANAHINEEISKTKMRLLIVAPHITDINVSLLESLPKHTNIRIAASINPNSEEDLQIIQRLEAMQNVSYRHRELQDLYGINRDYEEVILCILSETEIGQKRALEIGGIGSIIPEHIKIFVPVLEEAWIGAQKTVMPAMRASFVTKTTPNPQITNSHYSPPSIEQQSYTPENSMRTQPELKSQPSITSQYEPKIETNSQKASTINPTDLKQNQSVQSQPDMPTIDTPQPAIDIPHPIKDPQQMS
ncbi:MAG: hypothetical protein ACFE9R_15105, partial [Candidatus Hermodarchaeota archaeon]